MKTGATAAIGSQKANFKYRLAPYTITEQNHLAVRGAWSVHPPYCLKGLSMKRLLVIGIIGFLILLSGCLDTPLNKLIYMPVESDFNTTDQNYSDANFSGNIYLDGNIYHTNLGDFCIGYNPLLVSGTKLGLCFNITTEPQGLALYGLFGALIANISPEGNGWFSGDVNAQYIDTNGNELLAHDIIRHTITADDVVAGYFTEAWSKATKAKVADLHSILYDVSSGGYVSADASGGAEQGTSYDGANIIVDYITGAIGWEELDIITTNIIYEK